MTTSHIFCMYTAACSHPTRNEIGKSGRVKKAGNCGDQGAWDQLHPFVLNFRRSWGGGRIKWNGHKNNVRETRLVWDGMKLRNLVQFHT